ncbi:baseplate J/gp47 family protein [Streptomyces sp. NPDC052164]|uniref:baseplate J/gp47 family protein n=1 Tax=Streptomyces sp. NPDC052164 TaxID=3155529 RepID=UPI003432897A
MTYGVTDEGFVLKGIDQLLAESRARARIAFGDDADVRAASPLGKILEVAAAEDSELWKRMEALFYAQFPATATGTALGLLGDDAGLPRRAGRRTGDITFVLGNAAPNRAYVVPEGTLLLTTAPPSGLPPARVFATEQPVVLTLAAPKATVTVRALEAGDEEAAAETVTRVHPEHEREYLADWAGATLVLSNPAPFTGPLPPEDDASYRDRLIALPHALWTTDSVRQAALRIEDVVDARVTDELGGLDVSQVFFDGFDFGERVFSAERRIGEPYFAEVAVAHRGPRPWLTTSGGPAPVTGVHDLVAAAVERVRPIGVHVNVVEADHIEVAVRAEVVIDPRFDPAAVETGILARLAHDIGRLRLGDDVLYARVMCALVDEPGVTDVRNLHLRRCPPAFGRFGFGTVPYQLGAVEAPVGESLVMGPTEMALFTRDSSLSSIEVVPR